MTQTELRARRQHIRLLLTQLTEAINAKAQGVIEGVARDIESTAGTIVAEMQIEGITE